MFDSSNPFLNSETFHFSSSNPQCWLSSSYVWCLNLVQPGYESTICLSSSVYYIKNPYGGCPKWGYLWFQKWQIHAGPSHCTLVYLAWPWCFGPIDLRGCIACATRQNSLSGWCAACCCCVSLAVSPIVPKLVARSLSKSGYVPPMAGKTKWGRE